MNAETPIMQTIRLSIGSRPDTRIFRNNVGRIQDQAGRWHVFGLAPGSSDLIGFKSIIITPAMVGRKIAAFTAIEVKAPGARTDPSRLEKQTDFISTINEFGGLAGFAHSVKEAQEIIYAF